MYRKSIRTSHQDQHLGRAEERKIKQRETLNFSAVATKTSTDPTRSSGSEVAVQSCPFTWGQFLLTDSAMSYGQAKTKLCRVMVANRKVWGILQYASHCLQNKVLTQPKAKTLQGPPPT
jgi:hypothetical protein